jgi:hypothetical protein
MTFTDKQLEQIENEICADRPIGSLTVRWLIAEIRRLNKVTALDQLPAAVTIANGGSEE